MPCAVPPEGTCTRPELRPAPSPAPCPVSNRTPFHGCAVATEPDNSNRRDASKTGLLIFGGIGAWLAVYALLSAVGHACVGMLADLDTGGAHGVRAAGRQGCCQGDSRRRGGGRS